MPGKAKGGKGKHVSSKTMSRSARAGLQLLVGKLARFLKRGRYTEWVGAGTPVYMAAVPEYLVADVLELAGNAAKDQKKARINPRHILLAIRSDEEINQMLANTSISVDDVIPCINRSLLPYKKAQTQAVWLIF